MTRIRNSATSDIIGYIACSEAGVRAYDAAGKALGYFISEDRATEYIVNLKPSRELQ